jgi:lipoprotein-anchoring transpeptidase ErfK/SrfK
MHLGIRRILASLALTSTLATPALAQASTDTTARSDSARTMPASPDSAARQYAVAGGPAAASSTAAVESSAKPARKTPNPSAGALLLVADISSRKLHLYEGNELVKSYDVAVGTAEDPTPRGTFRIRKLVWNPGWVPPNEKWARNKTAKAPGEKGNPMKLVKIFFREPDYYIHGTGALSSLGKAASHGCLRMNPTEAAEVAQYIMEHGGSPRDESWFRRIFRFRSQTKVVYLDNTVPLTIRG